MLKKSVQQGRSERRPEASLFSPARPKLPRQLVLQVGYVEDLNDARTTHGKRRVSARLGRAGEKSGFFSILPENYLSVRTDWSAKLTSGLG